MSEQPDFKALREEYTQRALRRADACGDPIDQFRLWFDDAVKVGVRLANGMTLSTVGDDGQPSSRVVLLKEFDQRGFVFFTNLHSRKGREAKRQSRVALSFWWVDLERQIRIEGTVSEIDEAESDAYFATRPRASNLSAMASEQSAVVSDRGVLEDKVAGLEASWKGRELGRPAHWGGLRLAPTALEFWQGRADRLHDRLRYFRDGKSWRIERLAP